MIRKSSLFPVVLLCLLALLVSSAALPAKTAQAGGPALVRIELAGPAGMEILNAAQLPVFTRLFTVAGQEAVLALASPEQQQALRSQGLLLQVLDANASGASYYLVAGLEETLPRVSEVGTLLSIEGRQAVVRAGAEEADRLARLGLQVRPLVPQTIVLAPAVEVAASAVEAAWNPLVQGMIDQVNQNTIYTYTGNLSGEWSVTIGGSPYTIATRYTQTTTPIQKATQFTYEHFQKLGLAVQYHSYKLGVSTKRNVVAEQKGQTRPGDIYLITAHLDDTADFRSARTKAPGADDNASGSTAVLIAADILSKYKFDCTIRYVLFTGEEQGLYGSAAYAKSASSKGEKILGVLNLDMIAYNTVGSAETFELHTRAGNSSDLAIANLFMSTLTTYNITLTPLLLQDGMGASDHASFWTYNYPAVLAIEDWSNHTPYYHTVNDKLSSLDMAYYTDFVRASVGTIAQMAVPVSGQ